MNEETESKKAQTNRTNALLSTGPKTEAGKAVARLNAVKHGILSNQVLLKGEHARKLSVFRLRVFRDLKPVGELEMLLCDKIVANAWRLRRCLGIEASLLSEEHKGDAVDPRAVTAWERLERYETMLERSLFRNLHELERKQGMRHGATVLPPAVLDVTVSRRRRGQT